MNNNNDNNNKLGDFLAYLNANYNKITSERDMFLRERCDGPLVKSAINLLVAPPNAHKSTVAFLIAYSGLVNKEFNNVFYFDFNNSPSFYQSRYGTYREQDRLFYLTEYDMDKFFNDIDWLADKTPKEKVVSLLKTMSEDQFGDHSYLIVLDEVEQFITYFNFNELQDMYSYLRSISFLRGTVLLIEHTLFHEQNIEFNDIVLNFFYNSADVVFSIKEQKICNNDGAINVELACEKTKLLKEPEKRTIEIPLK